MFKRTAAIAAVGFLVSVASGHAEPADHSHPKSTVKQTDPSTVDSSKRMWFEREIDDLLSGRSITKMFDGSDDTAAAGPQKSEPKKAH